MQVGEYQGAYKVRQGLQLEQHGWSSAQCTLQAAPLTAITIKVCSQQCTTTHQDGSVDKTSGNLPAALDPLVFGGLTVLLLWLSMVAQITRGLLQKHGAERVRDTPITEVRDSRGGQGVLGTAGQMSQETHGQLWWLGSGQTAARGGFPLLPQQLQLQGCKRNVVHGAGALPPYTSTVLAVALLQPSLHK